MFCGPTGVGKTALCKTLSKTFFGTEERQIPRALPNTACGSDIIFASLALVCVLSYMSFNNS